MIQKENLKGKWFGGEVFQAGDEETIYYFVKEEKN